MNRRILLTVCVSLLGCATGPRVRPGPPMKATFAPPPGLKLLIEADEERYAKVVFAKGAVETTLREQARTEETYEALPHGGWLVTRTLLQDSFWADGRPTTPAFSQVELSLKFTIDAQGHFIEVTNVDQYIQALRSRAVDKTQLKLMTERLTPEFITEPVKRAWQAQFEGVCDRTLKPGDYFYRIDESAVPAMSEMPVRDLERETVIGSSTRGLVPVMEMALELGGESSDMVKTQAAQDFRSQLPLSMRGLTPKLKGTGSRVVSLSTCQTLSETSFMEGEIPLQARMQIPQQVAPKALEFRITRDVRRTSPAGAL